MRDLIQKIDNILNESVEQDSGLFEIGDEFGISFSEDLEIATTIIGFVEDGIVVELDEEAISIMESNGARFIGGYLEEGLRDPKDNPCWKGYKPVGTKKKNGKTVPNCVPKESVAEAAGLYGPFTVTINTGERPQSRTKTKKFRREDDAILWAEDWLEDFPQYVYATAEITDPEGNVVWYSDETMANGKGVAEAEYQGKDVPLGKKLPGDVKKYKVYVKNPKGNVVKVNFGDKKMRIKKSNPERRKSFRARHNCDNPGPRTSARYWSCKNW
jgi:hypothetical protein